MYAVTPAGADVLAGWLAEPTPMEPLRSELAVKMRGAAAGDRAAVLDVVRGNLADHQARLAHYEQLAKRDYPEPERLAGRDLDQLPRPPWRHPPGGVLGRLADRLPASARGKAMMTPIPACSSRSPSAA